MRMWMLPVAGMCRKHLMGEHVEMHMFTGSIAKGVSMKGYLNNGLLEPKEIDNRHTALVNEMTARGYNHKSPLKEYEGRLFNMLTSEEWETKVDINHNMRDIINRCYHCRERMRPFIKEMLANGQLEKPEYYHHIYHLRKGQEL